MIPTPAFTAADQDAREKWLPIETAPKDGTHILVWDTFGVSIAEWWIPDEPDELDDGFEPPTPSWYAYSMEEDTFLEPTHWMPLPAPPVQS